MTVRVSWRTIDEQMREYAPRLTSELGLTTDVASKLATHISANVRFLTANQKIEAFSMNEFDTGGLHWLAFKVAVVCRQ